MKCRTADSPGSCGWQGRADQQLTVAAVCEFGESADERTTRDAATLLWHRTTCFCADGVNCFSGGLPYNSIPHSNSSFRPNSDHQVLRTQRLQKPSSPCHRAAQMTDSRWNRGFGNYRREAVISHLRKMWIAIGVILGLGAHQIALQSACRELGMFTLLFRASSPQRAGETVGVFRCGHTGMTEKASGLARECVWSSSCERGLFGESAKTEELRMVYKLKGIAVKAKWKCLVLELWKVRQEVHWTRHARWERIVLKSPCATNHHCKVCCKNLSHALEKNLRVCKRARWIQCLHLASLARESPLPGSETLVERNMLKLSLTLFPSLGGPPCGWPLPVENEACDDQACVLVHSLHLHGFLPPSVFLPLFAVLQSAILRNERVARFFCFSSHNQNSCYGWWIVCSLFYWSRHWSLTIDAKCPIVFISETFCSRGRVWMVFRCQCGQVFTTFFCPFNCNLRTAMRFIFLKSFQNRRILFLFRLSQGFLCFETKVLFVRLSMFWPAKSSFLSDAVGYLQ